MKNYMCGDKTKQLLAQLDESDNGIIEIEDPGYFLAAIEAEAYGYAKCICKNNCWYLVKNTKEDEKI